MFRGLKIDINEARSTTQAEGMLARAEYDLILSDIHRDGEASSGVEDVAKLTGEPSSRRRIIFYVTKMQPEMPIPAGAFGITNRPDELLHLVIDALERQGPN